MTPTGYAKMSRRAEAWKQAERLAYKELKSHQANCNVCNPHYDCITAAKLLGAWSYLQEALEIRAIVVAQQIEKGQVGIEALDSNDDDELTVAEAGA